jgi:hypothetical protein
VSHQKGEKDMPVNVTVTLDSGSFLPMTGTFCEIGYFECEPSVSDLKIFIDGEEPDDVPSPFKLCSAGKCVIEVRHKDKDDRTNTNGIRTSKTFHSQLLHLEQLYGNHQPVERLKFDFVIRFDSGHFRASMVKKRAFKEHKKQPDRSYKLDSAINPTAIGPIAHNMVVYFALADDEALELARDGVTFWTSKGKTINDRIEIEIAADNSTAEKFYRHALKDATKDSYLLPNQGDPPPCCPLPPCPEFP